MHLRRHIMEGDDTDPLRSERSEPPTMSERDSHWLCRRLPRLLQSYTLIQQLCTGLNMLQHVLLAQALNSMLCPLCNSALFIRARYCVDEAIHVCNHALHSCPPRPKLPLRLPVLWSDGNEAVTLNNAVNRYRYAKRPSTYTVVLYSALPKELFRCRLCKRTHSCLTCQPIRFFHHFPCKRRPEKECSF